MPDQEHLILVLARDAEEITRDISVFFAPTRDFIEPGADWPQDLTRAELAALIPYLRRTIGSLSDVITHVAADNRADPEKARVVAEGVRLIEQGEEAIRAGETLFGAPPSPPGTRSQQAWPHRTSRTELPPGQPAAPCSPRPRLAAPPRPGRVTTKAPVPGTRANRTRLNL